MDIVVAPHGCRLDLLRKLSQAGAEAAADAVAAEAAEPLLYMGLRLLQRSERFIFMRQPMPTQPAAMPICSSEDASIRLGEAETQLEDLRAQLYELERIEAAKAMEIMLRHDPESLELWVLTDAARTIQAAFHGLMARCWMREQRAVRNGERCTQPMAAQRIQAGFRGMVARRWAWQGDEEDARLRLTLD